MKVFLQDIKILQESSKKDCKIIFLQDFDQILQEKVLQENDLTMFYKVLARFSYLIRKALLQDMCKI